ncbi:hypothetical protein LXL04_035371 [Taraxacum kok-saghyz]
MSTSRSKRSRAIGRSQPNPNDRSITFSSDEQREKFDKFLEKTFEPTRFITTPTLTKLHVLDGVRTMFRNIGWAGLFDIAKGYYLRPTAEFLSSLCAMIAAPIDDTFGPTDHLTGYNPTIFWCQITRLREYVPKYSKSSSIIHPVFRVAHRILASIISNVMATNVSYTIRALLSTTQITNSLTSLSLSNMDWSLSVITGPDPRANEPIHAPAQEHEHPPPPPVDYAQYHQTYQERFSSLDRQLAEIRDDVNYIATGLAEHSSNFEDFRTEQHGR